VAVCCCGGSGKVVVVVLLRGMWVVNKSWSDMRYAFWDDYFTCRDTVLARM
jgi:hypothetical protein